MYVSEQQENVLVAIADTLMQEQFEKHYNLTGVDDMQIKKSSYNGGWIVKYNGESYFATSVTGAIIKAMGGVDPLPKHQADALALPAGR